MKNKLKACGLVVEYNPFHFGHKHHLEEALKITKADVIIAAMSANFVQRGEPALVNKWERSRAAIENGVDLVLEIPTPFVLQRADIFVDSALKILSYLNVESLVYGSETNTKQNLQNFDQKAFESGSSYAKASNPLNFQANDILGSIYEAYAPEYGMKTHTIQRTNNYKDLNIEKDLVSASAIRHAVQNKLDFEKKLPMNLEKSQVHFIEDYGLLLNFLLIRNDAEELKEILLMDEGIENLFKKLRHETMKDLLSQSTSKRYTESRIKRTLMNALLNHKKTLPAFPKHARVLAMSEKGQEYLAQNRENGNFVTSFKDYDLKDIEMKASEIYALPYSKEYRKQTLQKEKNKPLRI